MEYENQNRLDFGLDTDFSGILTNPILDIAARFWEDDKYEAFKICYRTMRRIDDAVDNLKSTQEHLSKTEAGELNRRILDWLNLVRNKDVADPFEEEFVGVLEKYKIPLWPWERLYISMVYDLEHSGYRNLLTFLRYCEGAAIAPASVFMHLCGVESINGVLRPPDYDIRLAARPLALFSYMVHIIRDFQKDHKSNLNYFPDDMLSKHSLTIEEIFDIAKGGAISPSFRELMADYVGMAEYYRRRAIRMLDNISPRLRPRYKLSLEIIYQLYLQIFERVEPRRGNFTESELNPTPDEVEVRIKRTIINFRPV